MGDGSWLLGLLVRFRLQIAAACLILAAVLAVYAKGRHDQRGADAAASRKALAAAQERAGKLSDQLARQARTADTQAQASTVKIQTRTRTLIERIPYEVPASADPVLGLGWLRTYNASLGLPDDPATTGKPAERPAVQASDALAVIAGNNGSCAWYAENYPRLVNLYDQARETVNKR